MGLFRKKKIDDKKLHVYAIVKKGDEKNFLTLTLHKEQAFEFASKLIKMEHFEHYSLWLELHEKTDTLDAWQEYLTSCVDLEELQEYIIKEIDYKFSDVIAMLRMFGHCIPLDCSFDTDFEKAYRDSVVEICTQIKDIKKEAVDLSVAEKAVEDIESKLEDIADGK